MLGRSLLLIPTLVLLVLLAGCGDDAAPDSATGSGPDAAGSAPATYDPADDGSVYDSPQRHSDWTMGEPADFNAEVDLPDGRKVSFYYATGKGLAEQHYSPDADAWTKPRLVYRTDTDPCQGIAVDTSGGTVAVTADWALYCYDGEPPAESLAGAATGDLTEWDTDLTEDFDGWSAPVVAADGGTVTWTYQGDTGLTWTAGDGFDKQLGDG